MLLNEYIAFGFYITAVYADSDYNSKYFRSHVQLSCLN